MVVCFLIVLFLDFLKKIINGTRWLYIKTTGGLLLLLQNKKLEKVAVYPDILVIIRHYVLIMKKMIRAKIKKIKNLKFICSHTMNPDSQTNGQRDRERKKYGKILFLKKIFLKSPFVNSLQLWLGTLSYHYTKIKLKFKS